MTLYTAMPLEYVYGGEGADRPHGPFADVTVGGVTMRVVPVAPGIGRIERLLHAPLDCYLMPQYSPGQTVCYGDSPANAVPAAPGGEVPVYGA